MIEHDLGPAMNTVNWVLGAIALTAVVLRLYLRLSRRDNAAWDDAVIAVAGVRGFSSVVVDVC